MSVRRKAVTTAFGCIVACAWSATWLAGAPAIRQRLLTNVRAAATDSGRQPATDVSEGVGADSTKALPVYWARVRVVLPFLVLVDKGFVCGGTCGAGTTSWYLWPRGGAHPVWIVHGWIS